MTLMPQPYLGERQCNRAFDVIHAHAQRCDPILLRGRYVNIYSSVSKKAGADTVTPGFRNKHPAYRSLNSAVVAPPSDKYWLNSSDTINFEFGLDSKS